jgi:FkbM family methyltransferase
MEPQDNRFGRYISLMAVQMGCEVLAIEPNPLVAARFRKSIGLQGSLPTDPDEAIQNEIVLREVALSDREATFTLCHVGENPGASELETHGCDTDTVTRGKAEVSARTLDSLWVDYLQDGLLRELPTLHPEPLLMKMDVQLHWVEAIAGAHTVLKKDSLRCHNPAPSIIEQ